MNNIFVPNIGDLSDIQRVSYYKFLLKGLEKELESLNSTKMVISKNFLAKKKKKINYKIYFVTKDIKFSFPEDSFIETDEKEETYSINAYLPIFYSCKQHKPILSELENSKTINVLKKISSFQKQNFNILQKTITPYSKFLYKKTFKETLKTIYCCGNIYLTKIPLITEHGTFLITGCERIIVSQLIRSPGIYFRRELNPSKDQSLCTATIISDKGLWTKFVLTTLKKGLALSINATDLSAKSVFNQQAAQIKRMQREWEFDTDEEEEIEQEEISIFSFLKYFNIFYNDIEYCLLDSEKKILSKFLKKTDFENRSNKQEIKNILESLFYETNSGCFSIGENGRRNINYKFEQNVPLHVDYLIGLDFISIIKTIINLKFFGGCADDIDHIKNKQIRPVGDILQNQFHIGYLTALADLKFQNKSSNLLVFKEKKNLFTFDNILFSSMQQIWDIFLDFFKLSEISQYMDETNALAEMAHKRRISVFGPNGLERDNISDMVRDIHPSQYAKICPIETPEGETAGLVSSLALFSRFNNLGYLETPCHKIENGRILKNQPAVYLNSNLEYYNNLGFCDVCIEKGSSKIVQDNIYIKNDIDFSSLKKEKVSFITLSPIQLLSLSTNLVPFIEHDDANRGLMGANMQRQAVPLLYSNKALVGTGLEAPAVQDSGMIVTSYTEGQILNVTNKEIYAEDLQNQKIIYQLKKYYKSNQDTAINQQACVWPGEKVFSNQIIADGGGTLDGEFALGKNLLIAYMPWEGYNFEDAIIINERLVFNNSLTSIQIEEYDTYLNSTFFDDNLISFQHKKEAIEEQIRNSSDFGYIQSNIAVQILKSIFDEVSKKKLGHLNKKKIYKEALEFLKEYTNKDQIDNLSLFLRKILKNEDFSFYENNDISTKIYKIKKQKKSKKIAINSDLDDKDDDVFLDDAFENEEDLFLDEIYLAHFHLNNFETRNLDSNSIVKEGSYIYPNDILVGKVKVRTQPVSEKQKLLKFLGKIYENENYTDISFRSPLKCEGRVLEVRLFEEGITDKSLVNDSEPIYNNLEDFSIKNQKIKFFVAQIRKIEVGDKLAGRHGNKGVISKIVPQQDMPFLPDGTPIDIIFNPLGVPSRMNVGQVFESLLGFAGFYLGKRFKIMPFDELFGAEASRILTVQKLKEARKKIQNKWIFSSTSPGKILLKDGRTGEFFDNPILVGKSYIIKLIHLVKNKIHARSIGPYSLITEQPLAGKSSHGGQRFGEMESWALEGFGCASILHELFTIKSDDINARNDLYLAIASGNFAAKPNLTVGETFLTLIRELNALGLDFIQKKINLNIKENSESYLTLQQKNYFLDIEKKLALKTLITKAKKREFILNTNEAKKDFDKKDSFNQNYSKSFLKSFLNIHS